MSEKPARLPLQTFFMLTSPCRDLGSGKTTLVVGRPVVSGDFFMKA
jgi:hypothetical protein